MEKSIENVHTNVRLLVTKITLPIRVFNDKTGRKSVVYTCMLQSSVYMMCYAISGL